MFRFEHPMYLYALVAIPILILFFVAMRVAQRRALEQFGDLALIRQLTPQMSKYKHTIKFVLLMVALVFLIVGWSNPQWGTKKEKVKQRSADVFLALDISNSMLAQDIRPSRMDRARQFSQRLVEELRGERIGTIIFAGNAYLQMPLTTDYSAAELFVKSANPNMAPSQGTAIGEAIQLAERSFEEENKNHKALIIISDGEDHDEESIGIAEAASENGLLIFTVGVGTPQGSFIPVVVNGRQDYKRDKTGNPVRSQLNEEMLKEIADVGEGAYFNLAADTDEIVESIRQRIDQIEKRELEQRVFNEYESYFQYFLGIALLLIIIEFMISYRKNRYMVGKDLFQ